MRRAIDPAELRFLRVFTREEAAAFLRCSPEHVLTLVADGRLRRLRYTRTLLFHRRELERFLREQTGPEAEEGKAS